MFTDDDLLPLSALQHLLFCERQCALIHLERIWVENPLRLLQAYDETEDSLRFYFLGRHWKTRIEHFGIKTVLDLDEPLIA